MHQSILKYARLIYVRTPSTWLRTQYLKMFARFVRERKACVTVDGINYALDLKEEIDRSLYLGQYEPEVTEAIKKYTKHDMIIVDIGANIGAHALRFAKLLGSSGQVYAFEPTEYAFRKLVTNIGLNPFTNINPIQAALSDENRMNQSANFRSSWLSNGGEISSNNTVDFVRLDDWCIAHDIERIDLIKLDVDGFEYKVLNGAVNILQTCRPPIILEVFSDNFREPLSNPFAFLYDIGYTIFDIRSGCAYSSLDELETPLCSPDGTITGASYNAIALCT